MNTASCIGAHYDVYLYVYMNICQHCEIVTIVIMHVFQHCNHHSADSEVLKVGT